MIIDYIAPLGLEHREIEGWASAGMELIYANFVEKFPSSSHFVEVGAFAGRHFMFMAQQATAADKWFYMDAIDLWIQEWKGQEVKSIFRENLKKIQMDTQHRARSHQEDSVQAAVLFEDQSIDFVFLDADHEYESIKAEIPVWLPKVKPGGWIGGHDHTSSYPGVIQAVSEEFKGKATVIYDSWIVEVE